MSRMAEIWDKMSTVLVTGPVREPLGPIRIPPKNVKPPPAQAGPAHPVDQIEPQAGYVGIRINQLYLHHGRRWFSEVEPVVYSATEFLYDGKTRTDALVIGPRKEDNSPSGMVLQNTSVFGIHPYRGDDLVHTIILSRMPTSNMARSLIEVVQGVSSAIDLGANVATWTKLGALVLDGFDKLVGTAGLVPLIGAKLTFNPDRNEPVRPGYFALVAQPGIDPDQLWVKDSQLLRGPSEEAAKPYRDSDYVLYELTATPEARRGDIDRLPFMGLWDEAKGAVEDSSDQSWQKAKTALAALTLAIYRSPDLIRTQRDELADGFEAELVRLRKRIVAQSHLGPQQLPGSELRLQQRLSRLLELQ